MYIFTLARDLERKNQVSLAIRILGSPLCARHVKTTEATKARKLIPFWKRRNIVVVVVESLATRLEFSAPPSLCKTRSRVTFETIRQNQFVMSVQNSFRVRGAWKYLSDLIPPDFHVAQSERERRRERERGGGEPPTKVFPTYEFTSS